MTQYLVGETKRIQCTFTNAAGVASDPTTVQLRVGVVLVDGTVDTLNTYTYAASQLVKSSTGVYYKDYTFTQSGRHKFEFTTTGTPTTVVIQDVDVETELTWQA